MSATRYEDPFRTPYELGTAAAWGMAAASLVASSMVSGLPAWPLLSMAGLAAGLALLPLPAAFTLIERRRRMKGYPLEFMALKCLHEKVKRHQGMVWLGKGFRWSQQEAQRTYDLVRIDPEKVQEPDEQSMGQPWIHAMGDGEEDLYIPLKQLERHMLILGTTGAGKTRLLEHLIGQAQMRGECVIVIDPKGDKDLCNGMRDICHALGRPELFVYFHPAHPKQSARIDPLKNFNRPAELATRLANLLPIPDAFTQFSQMVLNNLCQGMLMIDAKPTILALRRMIEGGLPGLVRRACEAWFTRKRPTSWEAESAAFRKKVKGTTDEDIALAYVEYYRSDYQNLPDQSSAELEGLFNTFEHDKTHASKMMASMMPLLNQLTTGELGKLLSPDHTDMKDPRPITNLARICEMGQVCYIGLDSLSDAMVGSAMGSMIMSDLATVAGDRYNYGEELKPINVYIDEAAEVVNLPTIQVLNKGRGAGFRLTLSTQTLADFIARLGGEDKARMILGNVNNLLSLQVVDAPTQEYITENFPQTVLRKIVRSQSGSAGSDADLSYGGSASESLAEEPGPLFQSQLLGCLPTLEYFCNVAGGRIMKVRIPILKKEALALAA